MSIYIGYTIARLETLLANAQAAYERASTGKMIQRAAMGDLSVAFATDRVSAAELRRAISEILAALAAARAAPDGLVPVPAPRRALFPWP